MSMVLKRRMDINKAKNIKTNEINKFNKFQYMHTDVINEIESYGKI